MHRPRIRASRAIGVAGIVLAGVVAPLAGCIALPSAPAGPTASPASNGRPDAEIFQPEPRGVPFYADLSPETEGGEGGDFDPDVSPDGHWLVFSSTRHTQEPKLFLKETRTGALYQKSHGPGQDIQPKFSPDGQWIAFSSNRGESYDILIIPAGRNGAHWQLTHGTGDEIHPTWSPDGKRIAYSAREPAGDWTLWIIELAGQRRTQLGPGLYPEWSPAGDRLAFQRPSQRGMGWYGIWIVSPEGGAPQEVATDMEHGYVQPSWSPSAQQLVFATMRVPLERPWEPAYADDLWLVDLAEGQRFRLTSDDASDYAPAWGLNGRLYFTSHRGGDARLWSLVPAAPARPIGMAEEPRPEVRP